MHDNKPSSMTGRRPYVSDSAPRGYEAMRRPIMNEDMIHPLQKPAESTLSLILKCTTRNGAYGNGFAIAYALARSANTRTANLAREFRGSATDVKELFDEGVLAEHMISLIPYLRSRGAPF